MPRSSGCSRVSDGLGGLRAPLAAWLLCAGCAGDKPEPTDDTGTPATVPEDCAPLGDFGGTVVDAAPGDDLAGLVASLTPGSTLRLAAGTYELTGGDAVSTLEVAAAGVQIRGATGDPADVVLTGGLATTTLIDIHASDVLVADLTVRDAYGDAIHVTGDGAADVTGVTVFHVVGADNFGAAVRVDATRGTYADGGTVACSTLSFSATARAAAGGDCNPAGVDALQAQGWSVRDNDISGFWCDSGGGRPGIRFATGSANTVIERNVLRDNATGIAVGSTSYSATDERDYADEPCAKGYEIGHYGGIVRNNMVSALDATLAAAGRLGVGIQYAEACGAAGYHNTVMLDASARASEEWLGNQGSITILNDLMSSPPSSAGGSASIDGQQTAATVGWFVDAAAGDLHLVAGTEAEGVGSTVPAGACDTDFDGETRGSPPDVGADER